MANIPPETRFWRTDLGHGRNIYMLLSNDPTKPSDNDPLIGSMESSAMAEDVVNTHNGAMAMYGRRYEQVLAAAEVKKGAVDDEVYFKVSRTEREELLELLAWLHQGPVRSVSVLDKLSQALGESEDG